MRSWVRGKRAWFGVGERGKTYFEVPARALLGEVFCWDDISPKRSKVELESLGACHEGWGMAPRLLQEKVPRQTNKQNSFLFSSDGEWHTDGLVVVGKYTHNKQRLLRAKIVKSGHGRHYKGALAVYRKDDTSITVLGI